MEVSEYVQLNILLHRHCITTIMVLYNQWNMTSLLTKEYSFVRSLRERIFNYSCSVFVSPLPYNSYFPVINPLNVIIVDTYILTVESGLYKLTQLKTI